MKRSVFQRQPLLLALIALLLTACGAAAPAPDASTNGAPDGAWPQWRGPQRDGISPATGLLQRWARGEPREVWRRPIGPGFSTIAVRDGRAYTLAAEGEEEVILALDAADGSERWRAVIGSRFDNTQGDGPRSTPTVMDGVVYALGSYGTLMAVGAEDGSTLWRQDIAFRPPQWGYASSPLIDGERVIVHIKLTEGPAVVAFDRQSGNLLWSGAADHAGYASPLALDINGRHQIVSFLGTQLVGLSPETGETLWSYPWSTRYGVNAADPIFVAPDKLFISSGYDMGAAYLQVVGNPPQVETLWTERVMKNHYNSSVRLGPQLYGFDNGTLKCIDIASGETRWRKRGFGKGSLIAAEDKLIILGDDGTLALAEATPEDYHELGRVQALTGTSWSSPSLAGGWLYLRNHQEIVCLNLRAAA